MDPNNTTNNISIDKTGIDPNLGSGASKGTVSSILGSRQRSNEILQKQGSSLLGSREDIEKQIEGVEYLFKELQKYSEEYQKTISKTGEFKELKKTLEELKASHMDIDSIIKNQNVKATELNKVYTNAQIALAKSREYSEEILDIHDETGTKLKEQTAEYRFQADLRKKNHEDTIAALQEEAKLNDKILKESQKNMQEAASKAVGSMRSLVSDISKTLDISKIAEQVEVSARTLIQEDLQRVLGTTSTGFGEIKQAVNDSYNTSLYNQTELMNAYSSLTSLGLNTEEEIKDNFSTVIRGQSILGMSLDTQQTLVSLGNKYNKDMLTFMTNRTAEYMQTATNLSKDQLNELVSLNTTLAKDLADQGYTDPAVLENLNNATVAISNFNQGDTRAADNYRSAFNSTATMDIGTAGAFFGKTDAQIREYLSTNGNNLYGLIQSGSQSKDLLNLAMQDIAGNDSSFTSFNLQADQWGVGQEMQATIRNLAEMTSAGTDVFSMIAAQQGEGSEDAALSMDELRNESLTEIQKAANDANAWLTTNIDWATIDGVQNSLVIITAILGAIEATLLMMSAKDMMGNLTNFLGGKGVGGTGKLATGANLLSKAIKPLAIAGTAMIGVDALAGGFGQTATDMYGEDVTAGERVKTGLNTAISGTGYKSHSDGSVDKQATQLSGAGSGAMKGAALGTLIAPGIGTLIGAGIGAVSGWFAGGSKADKIAEEQLKLQEEQLEKEEEIARNTEALADTSLSPTWAARQHASYRPGEDTYKHIYGYIPKDPDNPGAGGAEPATRTLTHAGGENTFTGAKGQTVGPWNVTSAWGPRGWWRYNPSHADAVKDPSSPNYNHYWYSDVHKGIDLSKSGTQAIYATAGGKAHVIDQGNSGFGKYVRVDGYDGNSYYYGHMSSSQPSVNGQQIEPGTLLGYMGNTGNSDGQHLHYEVRQNGVAVHPVPYLTSSIYSGNADGVKIASDSFDSSAPTTTTTASQTSNSTQQTFSEGPFDGYNLYETSNVKLKNIGGEDPVVAGLATINNTLIELSNRQTEQEAILQMLSNKGKQNPIMS